MAVDVELIRKNFFSIAERADELTETFYTTLFMRYPGVVPLFDGVNMEQQRKMLANAIVFAIENLETMDVARSTLEEMGHEVRIPMTLSVHVSQPSQVAVDVGSRRRGPASERRIPHERIEPWVPPLEHFRKLDLPMERRKRPLDVSPPL